RKFGQQAVPGVLHNTAPVFGDLWIDQLSEVSLEALVSPLLISPHQTRVTRHIGGKDGSEAADQGHDQDSPPPISVTRHKSIATLDWREIGSQLRVDHREHPTTLQGNGWD